MTSYVAAASGNWSDSNNWSPNTGYPGDGQDPTGDFANTGNYNMVIDVSIELGDGTATDAFDTSYGGSIIVNDDISIQMHGNFRNHNDISFGAGVTIEFDPDTGLTFWMTLTDNGLMSFIATPANRGEIKKASGALGTLSVLYSKAPVSGIDIRYVTFRDWNPYNWTGYCTLIGVWSFNQSAQFAVASNNVAAEYLVDWCYFERDVITSSAFQCYQNVAKDPGTSRVIRNSVFKGDLNLQSNSGFSVENVVVNDSVYLDESTESAKDIFLFIHVSNVALGLNCPVENVAIFSDRDTNPHFSAWGNYDAANPLGLKNAVFCHQGDWTAPGGGDGGDGISGNVLNGPATPTQFFAEKMYMLHGDNDHFSGPLNTFHGGLDTNIRYVIRNSVSPDLFSNLGEFQDGYPSMVEFYDCLAHGTGGPDEARGWNQLSATLSDDAVGYLGHNNVSNMPVHNLESRCITLEESNTSLDPVFSFSGWPRDIDFIDHIGIAGADDAEKRANFFDAVFANYDTDHADYNPLANVQTLLRWCEIKFRPRDRRLISSGRNGGRKGPSEPAPVGAARRFF